MTCDPDQSNELSVLHGDDEYIYPNYSQDTLWG